MRASSAVTAAAFASAACRLSCAWIALSISATSRILPRGTCEKALRYQCTTQRCQGGLRKHLAGSLDQTQTGVGDDQAHSLKPSLLQLFQERQPARAILLAALADAENLPITVPIDRRRYQQRH